MSDQPRSRRLALLIEYDGSRFGGSQLQKTAPSIQGALQAALHKLTGEQPQVALAGRTDAGVHASGQVAAFTTTSTLGTETFVSGLNAWLPEEIAVRLAREAPDQFDPRRDATDRTYRYTIYNGPERSPLHRATAWHVSEQLDAAAMREAARALIGEHDFAAFSRREGVRTVRCIRRCKVVRQEALITVEIEANAFLRQQMRRTAGALVQVGNGRQSTEEFRGLLQRAEPASAGPVAPAHGLCLLRVTYLNLDLCGENTLS